VFEDLRSVVRYIPQESPTRARTFGKKLREKVQPPAQHLLLGHEGRPGLPADIRELVLHPNYIAFYRVLEASRTAEILRIKQVAPQTP
jgi:toxin ParE1/3/4